MYDVVIAGVGIHPSGRFGVGYRRLGAVAARQALVDAGVTLDDLDMVLVANVSADMAKGHNVIEQLGRPGVPVLNVEAACASSAGTLLLASRLLESGAAKMILCLGVEEAPRGFIANAGFEPWQIASGLGVNPVYFALAAQELIASSDATIEDLADVSVKNHAHAVHNANAMYRRSCTREQVLGSPVVCPPLHLLMLCSPNEGAAAAVLMLRDEAERRNLRDLVDLKAVYELVEQLRGRCGARQVDGARCGAGHVMGLATTPASWWSPDDRQRRARAAGRGPAVDIRRTRTLRVGGAGGVVLRLVRAGRVSGAGRLPRLPRRHDAVLAVDIRPRRWLHVGEPSTARRPDRHPVCGGRRSLPRGHLHPGPGRGCRFR
jgi:hypothetical protein